MLSPLPTQLNPRKANDWVTSQSGAIESVANGWGSKEAKDELLSNVKTKVLPELEKGSEILKKKGRDNDFEEALAMCRNLIDHFGVADATEPQAAPAEASPAALGRLLAQKTPVDADEALADLTSLDTLLLAGALQTASDAELVLQRMQAHAVTLQTASQDAVDLGDDDVYAAPAALAKTRTDELQEKLRQETWQPFKLQDEVDAAHGSLIRSVDRLYDEYGDDFKELKLRLPEVVVVGAESVGKSSLLEKLAGLPFFPRGESVTTRICFRLRLHRLTANELASEKGRAGEQCVVTLEGLEVLLKFEGDAKYLRSIDEVRTRVQTENEKVQHANKGVVEDEIILNLYSSHFPDLTLVDLPGIIRARGPNDPKNIASICERMVRGKIKNEHAIILAVLNAREGIRGAAEGIRLVQDEKAEKRTLAVLTCVDRTDANDDIASIMRQEASRELPKLGHHYHACIGRDTKRTAGGKRAEPADNEAFLAAVRAGTLGCVHELLAGDKVSEAALDQGLALLAAAQVSESGGALAEEIKAKLLETQKAQALFEQRFFAPTAPGSTARSQFQEEHNVDKQLLAPDLQPYLSSANLSKRLSTLLTDHIKNVWAPQMGKKVKEASNKVDATIAGCGKPPPTEPAEVVKLASELLAEFRKLLGEKKLSLEHEMMVLVDDSLLAFDLKAARVSNGQVFLDGATRKLMNNLNFQEPAGEPPAARQANGRTPARRTPPAVTRNIFVMSKAVHEVFENGTGGLHLKRFPNLKAWILGQLQPLMDLAQKEAVEQFTTLTKALAADVDLPGVDKGDAACSLAQAGHRAMHRILVQQHVRRVFQKLPAALSEPPARVSSTENVFMQTDLLQEDSANAKIREKALRQREALEKVRQELRRYARDEPPRPEPPHVLCCPISHELMNEPVLAADNHTYDRVNIQRWIEERGAGAIISPYTREVLTDTVLRPNHAIRSQVREWQQKYGTDSE